MLKRAIAYTLAVATIATGGIYTYRDIQEHKDIVAINEAQGVIDDLTLQVHVFSRQPIMEYQILTENNTTWRNSIYLERAKADLSIHISNSQTKLDEYQDQVFPDLSTKDALQGLVTNANELVASSTDIETVQAQPTLLVDALAAYQGAHDAWIAEEARKAEEARLAEIARQEAAKKAEADRAAKAAAAKAAAAPKQSSGNGSTKTAAPKTQAPAPKTQAPKTQAPAAPAPAPAPAPVPPSGGGLDEKARSILSNHGCSSATVTWDSPLLPKGSNGAAAAWDNIIYLRSSMPSSRFNYVVAHECAHILQYRAFGGTYQGWSDLEATMNGIYGGSGYRGLEQNADCITQAWGYGTYNYTNSCGGARGDAARAVINGHRP